MAVRARLFKFVTFTVLGCVVFFCTQASAPRSFSAALPSSACHQHGQHPMPNPEPATHYCCEVGHSPATLPTYTSGSPLWVLTDQAVAVRVQEPESFAL